ncbi:MAG: hypothetical protein ABI873_19445, partial [Marmoricola sp.]
MPSGDTRTWATRALVVVLAGTITGGAWFAAEAAVHREPRQTTPTHARPAAEGAGQVPLGHGPRTGNAAAALRLPTGA